MLRGIHPGRLDVYLTFEQPTQTANSIGENETTWTVYKKMFGARGWRKSAEQYQARELVGNDLVEYTVGFDSGLTSTMRFKQDDETTYFYIQDVQQWKREGYSLIHAQRRDNQ